MQEWVLSVDILEICVAQLDGRVKVRQGTWLWGHNTMSISSRLGNIGME